LRIGSVESVNSPAWWVEGAALVFPNFFMRDIFDDLTLTQENGLSLERILNSEDGSTSQAVGWAIEVDWEDAFRRVRRGIVVGDDSWMNCPGIGPDEEYRHTSKCGNPHWFILNAYLAYLTSYQTLLVDLSEDMSALGFDGSFEKHVGMTVDEFYDSYNAFMREGDLNDPLPPGFFPTEPLSELVDFWAIKSG
jgi:hypothetical protein